MRTTIRLDEHLLAKAKAHATRSGRTLTALIEDALRQELQRRPASAERSHVKFVTFKGTGVQPGVDLEDSASLMDAMDG
jgi:Ribbon-helix-helix protein, copG family